MQHPVKNSDVVLYGASAVILNEKNEIALVMRDDMPIWTSIGGGRDPGENFEQTMRREVLEEVNAEVDIIRFLGDFFYAVEPGKYCHEQAFVCKPKPGFTPSLGNEGIAFQWFSFENLPVNIDAYDRAIITQAFKNEATVSMITGPNLVNFLKTVTDFKPFYMLEEWYHHPKVVEKRSLGRLRFDIQLPG